MKTQVKINRLKDLQNVKPLLVPESKLIVDDFGIETIPGKETQIQINLTDGSFVRLGAMELREFEDFLDDFDMWLTNPNHYHAELCEICQTYINESEDFKIEKEA